MFSFACLERKCNGRDLTCSHWARSYVRSHQVGCGNRVGDSGLRFTINSQHQFLRHHYKVAHMTSASELRNRATTGEHAVNEFQVTNCYSCRKLQPFPQQNDLKIKHLQMTTRHETDHKNFNKNVPFIFYANCMQIRREIRKWNFLPQVPSTH